MTPRLVLGLDPSLRAFGWALLRPAPGRPVLVDLGSWVTRVERSAGKFEDRGRRSVEIGRALRQLIVEHRPTEAFIESPVFMPHDGKMSVHASARVRGVAEGICLAHDLPLEELGTQEVKKAVAGSSGASKQDVAKMLFRLYDRDPRIGFGDDNASDALGVAHVGAHRGGSGVSVSSGVVSYRSAVEADDRDF